MILGYRYSNFFLLPLNQYFKNFKYNVFDDFPILQNLNRTTNKDYLKWVKIQKEYLSAQESMAVGITLFFDNRSDEVEFLDKIISYFEYSLNNSNDVHIKYLSNISLGLVYFKTALSKSEKKTQSKLMKISRFYFTEASLFVEHNELSLLYLALTEVAIGEIEEACRFISKASKTSQDPGILYQVLHKVYDNLGFKNISLFYENKAFL
jgi:tetratricopeptide (TPR) repeat protein